METSPDSPESREVASIQAELDTVRAQLRWTQFFSFGLGATMALLAFRLDQFQGRAVDVQVPVTQRLLQDLDRMNRGVVELQRFAASHPDYLPILQRYGLDAGTNLPVRVPALTPPPGSTRK
jgi:hypothetical protein